MGRLEAERFLGQANPIAKFLLDGKTLAPGSPLPKMLRLQPLTDQELLEIEGKTRKLDYLTRLYIPDESYQEFPTDSNGFVLDKIKACEIKPPEGGCLSTDCIGRLFRSSRPSVRARVSAP